MTRSSLFSTLIAAGAIAFSGTTMAQQTTVPATSGQASTQTPAGVPNPPQRPEASMPADSSMPASRANVRAEAKAQIRDSANTNTPSGEASTVSAGQPNAARSTSEKTRAEVRADARRPRPQFGEKGERPDVPSNPKDSTGTPQ